GYGIQFNADTNRAQQSLAVIDLNARPAPAVVQNVYFPTPQSAQVGAVFAPQAEADGSFVLYVSGGFENKVWAFQLRPGEAIPLKPESPGPNTKVTAPFIDLNQSALAVSMPSSKRYNNEKAALYPLGLAVISDGETLYAANNLDDSLTVINGLRTEKKVSFIKLRRAGSAQNFYPYAVAAVGRKEGPGSVGDQVYVSCWNDESVAAIKFRKAGALVKFIPVGRHPTEMIFNHDNTRLYVANSDGDSVSVLDTTGDQELERISVRLSEDSLIGHSPEGLALSTDGGTLYVANARSNSVAVVALSPSSRGAGETGPISKDTKRTKESGKPIVSDLTEEDREEEIKQRSIVRGFLPTGAYPSALAIVGESLFVGNGKGTGVENSSLVVNNSGRAPNVANDRFPVGTGRAGGMGGQFSISVVSGNISLVPTPDAPTLARHTQQVMRNNGLVGQPRAKLFRGRSPFKHVIYIIKENRTYDQVFGDLERAGNGERADGDPALAIFGAGAAARRPDGAAQNVAPNHHALALRFGLLDRFFVNAEASPDGHNWSTAAFSTDYVDKAFRWSYGGRGRGYDYEGFNRLPNIYPVRDAPPFFSGTATAADVAALYRRYVPYLQGSRDVAEPGTLYLWDAAARAGLSYRNYGEFIGTVSEADLAAINTDRAKPYPDISATIEAVPTKKSLENHFHPKFRNYDLRTPDAMIVESYRAAKESGGGLDPVITQQHADARFRGTSRLGVWLEEFASYAADLRAGRADRMPNLSVLRLSNDHTAGVAANLPTPQFFVADNDYALGRLVEAVSRSPYWKDTAIFVVEDDAQDGPDHVDAHRSVALVISAYNRPGALVHEFHNTVSLIRTMELLLGIPPMNQLDANAVPIDIFRDAPDLRPYQSILPDIALNNLLTPPPRTAADLRWMRLTSEQNMAFADMADPSILNQAIWYSVRGADCPMPEISRLPAFDAMRQGIAEEVEDEERAERSQREGDN
nr:bifunctional YncE family protein/alkaline phosphatase family protein [Pyrinomonadaceae bacterium]